MKKVILIFAVLLFAIQSFAQDLAHEYVVATITSPIGRSLNVAQKNFISVTATGARYQITASYGSTATMQSIISDGHYVAQTGTATLSAITASMLPNAAATYNLGSGTYTWLKGWINTLSSSSHIVTPYAVIATDSSTNIIASGDVKSATAHITTATITGIPVGAAAWRGAGSFSGVTTRAAVYLPGTLSSDYVVVTPVAVSPTRPVAGDLMNAVCKTDSLIVMRAAGTTSGGSFNYIIVR